MPCFRVPIFVHRIDAAGTKYVVKKQGPIVDAKDMDVAREKARSIFADRLDFSSIGEPEFLHKAEDHKALVFRPLSPELRPALSPDRDRIYFLDEALHEMAGQIRARRARLPRRTFGRKKAAV